MATKVLLVDDEKEFVIHLAERLEFRGLEVETASDGESALQLIKDKNPNVMVLDLQMPGMSGIETLKQAKKISPDLQVIMLTGYGTIETATEGKEYGALEYLIKPCDTVKLYTLIEEAMGK
jgi:DNA-binding NtrC family response regulator